MFRSYKTSQFDVVDKNILQIVINHHISYTIAEKFLESYTKYDLKHITEWKRELVRHFPKQEFKILDTLPENYCTMAIVIELVIELKYKNFMLWANKILNIIGVKKIVLVGKIVQPSKVLGNRIIPNQPITEKIKNILRIPKFNL